MLFTRRPSVYKIRLSHPAVSAGFVVFPALRLFPNA
jgi:hypothetical protein